MKLGFIADNTLSGIETDCRFAVEHGFEGLEFNYWSQIKDLDDATVQQMHALLKQHNVACSTFGIWGWNHLAADPAVRAESHRQLNRAIDYAQTMGAPVFITGGGHIDGNSVEQDVDAFAEVMRPFIDRIKAAGMELALYGFHGGSFLQTVDAYGKLWEKVDDVGIKFDPANVDHAGEDYLAVLRYHGDKIRHVHVKEHLNYKGEVASQPAAGMGDIHWGKVMAFLYENNYDGYLTIEPHGPFWSRGPLREKMLLLTQRHINQFLV